jgi:hypothetical protein
MFSDKMSRKGNQNIVSCKIQKCSFKKIMSSITLGGFSDPTSVKLNPKIHSGL